MAGRRSRTRRSQRSLTRKPSVFKRGTQEAQRRLHHETLEKRELLAADIHPDVVPAVYPGTDEAIINDWTRRLTEFQLSNLDEINATPAPTFAQNLPQGASAILFEDPADPNDFIRWRTSALDPGGAPDLGDGITLTWGIVPDGTIVSSEGAPSDLVAFFDGIYGSGTSNVLSDKPWFRIFENIYDVWGQQTGLNFVYEPFDDGDVTPHGDAAGSEGLAGVRADIRIAGAALDGDFNVLAYNFIPSGGGALGLDGDMVIDTSDIFYQLTSNDPTGLNIGLTNVLAHEVGHGLGLAHSLPVNQTKLMEPFVSEGFYGPQEDDLHNIHILYGDNQEPNDSTATAVDLGIVDQAGPIVTDLSIDNAITDVDHFRFELTADGSVDLLVRPLGSSYDVGPQPAGGGGVPDPNDPPVTVDRQAQNDLGIRLLDESGAILETIENSDLGVSEFALSRNLAAGVYFAQIYATSGSESQFYQLALGASALVDVGPQLLAIRPDKTDLLEDGIVLRSTPSEFNLYFAGGANLDESTITPETVKLIRAGEDGELGTGDDIEVQLGYVGLVQPGDTDPENLQQIVLRPASSASHNPTDPSFAFPDDLYEIQIVGSGAVRLENLFSEPFNEGVDFSTTFQLDRGAQVVAVVPQPIVRSNTTPTNPEGTLSQQRDVVEVYFDNQTLDLNDAEDVTLYRLIDLDDLAAPPLPPNTAVYDLAANMVTLTFPADLAEGNYRLDLGEEFIPTGPVVIGDGADDDNSSIDVPGAESTNLGALTVDGIRVTSRLTAQDVPIPPYVGSQDEPGHRQIQREAHIGAFGTDLTTPSDIRVIGYHFPLTLGTDSNGTSYPNLITETQKDIVRKIMDVYAAVSGYEFVEVDEDQPSAGLLMIGNGDFRAVSPSLGPNDGVAGLANGSFAMVNSTIYDQAINFYGDGFTNVMMHEIGHSLGLGHSYDIPSVMGAGVPNDVLPGDHDVVHLQRIVPPNNTDIDMYGFQLSESGRFTAETFAQRLPFPSSLSTVLTLYKQDGTSLELVARNDRFFGDDSYLDLNLEAGTYFLGVTSTGNDNYDPRIADSGYGGTTGGSGAINSSYEMELSFKPESIRAMRDSSGTPIDGDRDGKAGGVYSFYFQASDPTPARIETIFVDRLNDPTVGTIDGDGSLADPFDTISAALQAAENRIVLPLDVTSLDLNDSFTVSLTIAGNPDEHTFLFDGVSIPNTATDAETLAIDVAAAVNADFGPGFATAVGRTVEFSGIDTLDISASETLLRTPNIIRIIGNDFDGDPTTTDDLVPYLVGTQLGGAELRDGGEFRVPQGATAMIDAGVLFKMRRANIDAGSSTIDINRAGGAIQLLGTPESPVWMRSFFDDSFGGNSGAIGQTAGPGDFGGIVMRDDSDLEDLGIYLNYVSHADIRHAGGKVFVDSSEESFTPIHLVDARPALVFNTISRQSGRGSIVSKS